MFWDNPAVALFDFARRAKQSAKRWKPVHQAPVGSWWYDQENDRTIQVVYHQGDENIEFERYLDINAFGTVYTMHVDCFVAKFHALDGEEGQ